MVPVATAALPPGAASIFEDELGALDDDDEQEGATAQGAPGVKPGPAAMPPELSLSDAEIERRFHHEPGSLGPASVGTASAGALVNGVQMPKGERWQLLDPGRAWGTQETVDALVRCIDRVNLRFPGAPPLAVGHISARNGGHLSPHRSHQSGRDADIGYYYKTGTRPFVRASADNLDLPRTWALLKAALTETTVDMIFIDRGVQRVLADFAAQSGESAAFVDQVFQVRGKNPAAVIRHVRGHDNHIHFRFHNPIAEAMGQRVARFVTLQHAPAVVAASQAETAGYAQIRARSGDTLVILARRYGTSVEEIQRANRLPGNAIRAGVVYRIPQKNAPARPVAKVAQRRPAPKPAGAKPAASAPER
jgi:murein endopeptidase